jgi:hypothetical protein
MTLAPPRRTLHDSAWVAWLLPPGLSFSPLANDNGEEEEAEEAEDELLKGHAESEVDAEKEDGGGFIVVKYLPWICLSSLSISVSGVSVLCLSCVCLVSVLCLPCVCLVSVLCLSCVCLVSALCLAFCLWQFAWRSMSLSFSLLVAHLSLSGALL